MVVKTLKENDFKISPNKAFLRSNRIQHLEISLWLFQISATQIIVCFIEPREQVARVSNRRKHALEGHC